MSELLHYAAIAATAHDPDKYGSNADFIRGPNWNPLENDSEAFDLLVRCQLSIGDYICGDHKDWSAMVSGESRWYDGEESLGPVEFYGDDDIAVRREAFRAAIVAAASEIGKHYSEKGYLK